MTRAHSESIQEVSLWSLLTSLHWVYKSWHNSEPWPASMLSSLCLEFSGSISRRNMSESLLLSWHHCNKIQHPLSFSSFHFSIITVLIRTIWGYVCADRETIQLLGELNGLVNKGALTMPCTHTHTLGPDRLSLDWIDLLLPRLSIRANRLCISDTAPSSGPPLCPYPATAVNFPLGFNLKTGATALKNEMHNGSFVCYLGLFV